MFYFILFVLLYSPEEEMERKDVREFQVSAWQHQSLKTSTLEGSFSLLICLIYYKILSTSV